MRVSVAFRAFFAALFSRPKAEAIAAALAGQHLESETKAIPQPAAPKPAPAKLKPPARSDAVTLLATLQREARFVDIVKEPLNEYSDAQIGAAARDVLRDCGVVLDRLFDLSPIVDAEEATEIETPPAVDAARYRLTGSVTGEPPFRGALVHHGWQAGRCELPKWSGSDEAALVVAPVEIEVRAS